MPGFTSAHLILESLGAPLQSLHVQPRPCPREDVRLRRKQRMWEQDVAGQDQDVPTQGQHVFVAFRGLGACFGILPLVRTVPPQFQAQTQAVAKSRACHCRLLRRATRPSQSPQATSVLARLYRVAVGVVPAPPEDVNLIKCLHRILGIGNAFASGWVTEQRRGVLKSFNAAALLSVDRETGEALHPGQRLGPIGRLVLWVVLGRPSRPA